jgi:hypothetical protein
MIGVRKLPLVVAIGVFFGSCGLLPVGADRAIRIPGPPKLLLLQNTMIEASYIDTHIDEVDALPFDGVMFSIPSTGLIRGTQTISRAQFTKELEPMMRAKAKLTKVRHNFVVVRLVQVGPFAEQTAAIAASLANLAKAARSAGLAGIVYDNEDYEKNDWSLDDTCAAGTTLVDCQRQAVEAGRTTMRRIMSQWPDVRFMTLFGPSMSHVESSRAILNEDPQPRQQILGAYATGMHQATLGTRAVYIDGGEKFSVHTAAEAAADRQIRKVTMPAVSPLIPDASRAIWARDLSLAYTLYDEREGTPSRWQDDIAVNLAAADDYAWAFSYEHVWLGPVPATKLPATSEWIAATQAGRAAAETATLAAAATTSVVPTSTISV